jgi:hypothetical protein
MPTRVMGNTAYLIKWGIYSETPSSIRFQISGASKWEWWLLAFPYPAGTTFDLSNPTTSLAGLYNSNYFYDSTTHLLYFSITPFFFTLDSGSGAEWGSMEIVEPLVERNSSQSPDLGLRCFAWDCKDSVKLRFWHWFS